MAGLTLFPHVSPPSGAPALSTDLLAIVVAIVAFVVSGIFLLFLVPDRSAPRVGTATEGVAALPPRIEADSPSALPVSRIEGAIVSVGAEVGRGTYGPLGGAGGPPRRLARHLPVEREGMTQFVAVDDIVAVHANAHYSYIFDGTSKMFCPLAIGDVESRLDGSRFVRVHRSHIVNIDFVSGLKRAGDNGVVELAGADRHTVPVSRSRIGGLKSRLGMKLGDAVP
jgi:LytTr DNA-binding domain